MRIVVVDPLGTGDATLRRGLARVYGLTAIPRATIPRRDDPDDVAAWIVGAGFPDGSLLPYPGHFAPAVTEAIAAVGAHVVTLLRDPYDAFAAAYQDAQARVEEGGGEEGRKRRSSVMVGKPIDHPDVLGFLSHEFRSQLERADAWQLAGAAIVARQEDVAADPVAALHRVTELIQPVDPAALKRALKRDRSADGARAGSGDRDDDPGGALGDIHLALFRDHHADLIATLSYAVREPSPAWADEEASDAAAAGDEMIAPAMLRRFRYARRGGHERFVRVGDELVERFVAMGGLRPDDRVLDVGSGVGRIAFALTKFLDERGRYEGFDVDAEGIRWSQENISPRFPNFQFQVADVYSKNYNPAGSQPPSAYRFPFADGTFSFVFLTSVFTHLLPEAAANYLREIARVLEPGGRCYCTWNLLTPESLDDLARGAGGKRFPIDKGFYRLQKEDNPERSIAFDEGWVRDTIETAGLRVVEPIHYRGWSRERHAAQEHQDIVIAARPG
jgi:SAM-dependent methyltransferase